MDTQTQKIMFSSKSDEWGTPTSFFNKLNKRFDFTLDPCSTPNNKKCDKFYTIEDDGLSKSWKNERVFVNPPYGNIAAWVEKAYLESCKGAFVALLIPNNAAPFPSVVVTFGGMHWGVGPTIQTITR